jgi:hypothetical protein
VQRAPPPAAAAPSPPAAAPASPAPAPAPPAAAAAAAAPATSVARALTCADLVKAILSSLPVTGVCKCAAVCRLWRQVADSDCFWQSVEFGGARAVTSDQVRGAAGG